MKTFNKSSFFILTALFFVSYSMFAQTTAIPDPYFEQALIDLGIDSDGVINGQVLTSDVENVVILDLAHIGVLDITGIEDFAALEILDVSNTALSHLDVSSNIQLRELYASNTGTEILMISSLDLSNNVNLEILHCENLFFLENLNLKNGNNSILNVIAICEEEGEPCQLPLNCITVDNEEAANNDEEPYASWVIDANYVYSEDCSLGINDNNSLASLNLYPNPTKNSFQIEKNTTINLKSITIYNALGAILAKQEHPINTVDISSLNNGILFVKLETNKGTITKKIVKQ